MNNTDVYSQLWHRLLPLYDKEEAVAIARLVLDTLFQLSLTDIVMGRADELSVADRQRLNDVADQLVKGMPVQYALHECVFCDHVFHVASGVLIPRPETEELCRHILARTPYTWHGDILDIGTGSGCIAVTLAAELQFASVTAWDISPEALVIAARNARCNGVLTGQRIHDRNDVVFQLCDALNPPDDTNRWDIIVSNPPYICEAEKAAMQPNVLDHEPHLALFVPDDDPLRFYRAIGQYAVKALRPGGRLFFEINPLYARPLADMLTAQGFADVSIHQDDNGKDRFIVAEHIIAKKE